MRSKKEIKEALELLKNKYNTLYNAYDKKELDVDDREKIDCLESALAILKWLTKENNKTIEEIWLSGRFMDYKIGEIDKGYEEYRDEV